MAAAVPWEYATQNTAILKSDSQNADPMSSCDSLFSSDKHHRQWQNSLNKSAKKCARVFCVTSQEHVYYVLDKESTRSLLPLSRRLTNKSFRKRKWKIFGYENRRETARRREQWKTLSPANFSIANLLFPFISYNGTLHVGWNYRRIKGRW